MISKIQEIVQLEMVKEETRTLYKVMAGEVMRLVKYRGYSSKCSGG